MASEHVLLAYSGGLDTSFLVAWLTQERGFHVTTLYVDCGGLSPREQQAISRRARAFGAVRHGTVDARSELFQRALRWLIAGNVRRGGSYPLCVAAERGIQAQVLAETAVEGGFATVAHGCTGAGNDQIRFEASLHVMASELKVLAPIRDEGFTRAFEREWLHAHGLEGPTGLDGGYSVNQGLWGLTIGGHETHHADQAIAEDAWIWTRSPDPTPETLHVTFERGVPVAVNDQRMEPVALIEWLNHHAGRKGVGRGYHVGDTLLGFKGRIAFEAPAAEVLLTAHRELEKLVLTEEQRITKDQLGDLYGRLLHQGRMFEPLLQDAEMFFASSQERVNGRVRVQLGGRQVLVDGIESPHDVLAASDGRYGERPAAGTNPAGAKWLARIFAEPARLARKTGGATPAPSRTASAPRSTATEAAAIAATEG